MARIMIRRKNFKNKTNEYSPLLNICDNNKNSLKDIIILRKLLDKAINKAEIWKKNSKIDWE